ncbi:MAG: 8-amino-7-oxononanoate synthase, partial [Gordonia sp. (in: high G+C Gram-positive bacteria)]
MSGPMLTGLADPLAWLADAAAATAAAGLHRSPIARPVGAAEVNLASNDYLG